MHKTFPTEGPTSLYVEIGSGDVKIHTIETTTTEVNVDGRDADDVIVEQRGEQIVVMAPQRRGGLFFGSDGGLSVTVTMPLDSDLATKLGSADLVATGRYGAARIRSGSGEVHVEQLTDDAVVETGSGDIELESSLGDLRIKSGSGDVTLGRSAASLVVSTGSGSVQIRSAEDTAAVKSGSGDIQVEDAHTDVSTMTGSGDLNLGRIRRGKVKAKAASGDIHVGVPAGIPVWTDISCISGSVRSNLQGAGQPDGDQDYIEIRATTVSGDITLSQL
jgi:DUF4097 and DUF4098 domain-containing protein YvlB